MCKEEIEKIIFCRKHVEVIEPVHLSDQDSETVSRKTFSLAPLLSVRREPAGFLVQAVRTKQETSRVGECLPDRLDVLRPLA